MGFSFWSKLFGEPIFTSSVNKLEQKAITIKCLCSVLRRDYMVGGEVYAPEDAIPAKYRALPPARKSPV